MKTKKDSPNTQAKISQSLLLHKDIMAYTINFGAWTESQLWLIPKQVLHHHSHQKRVRMAAGSQVAPTEMKSHINSSN